MTESLDIRTFTPEEKQDAERVRSELDTVLGQIEKYQDGLEKDFVKLGTLLTKTQDSKSWIIWGFKSYNAFLESIEPRVKKGRTHLYACAKIAAQLLPVMSEEDLLQTGISKASALASAMKKADKKPSEDLLAKAKDSKVTGAELDSLIGAEYNFQSDYEDGDWFNLSGVFMTDGEKAEFMRGVKVACHCDPPLQHEITNWQDASAGDRKQVLQRWIMEFLAGNEAIVERGQ